MSREVIEQIRQRMESRSPEPQVNFVLLGGNNLRRLQQNPSFFLKLVKALLEMSKTIPNNHLVLGSLIPSPLTKDLCDQVFLDVDQKMKEI